MLKKLGLLGLVGITLFATGCGCDKNKDNEKNKEPEIIVNTEPDVIKDQTFDGLTMSNTSLITTDGKSTLVTEVSNNTGADYYLNQFIIIVKDGNGNILANIPGYVGSVIPNGETRVINSDIDTDLSSAKSIEYTVKK